MIFRGPGDLALPPTTWVISGSLTGLGTRIPCRSTPAFGVGGVISGTLELRIDGVIIETPESGVGGIIIGPIIIPLLALSWNDQPGWAMLGMSLSMLLGGPKSPSLGVVIWWCIDAD